MLTREDVLSFWIRCSSWEVDGYTFTEIVEELTKLEIID